MITLFAKIPPETSQENLSDPPDASVRHLSINITTAVLIQNFSNLVLKKENCGCYYYCCYYKLIAEMLAWPRILLMPVTRDIVWLWKKSQSITDPFATLPRHHLFTSPQQFKTIFCNKFLLEGINKAFLHLHKKVYFACAHKTRKSTQCKCRKILPRSTATCGSSASHTFMVQLQTVVW